MKTLRLVFAGLVLLPGWLAAQSARVVTVDFQQVFEEYGEVQQLDRRMTLEVQEFRAAQEKQLQALQERTEAFNALRRQAAAEGLPEQEREALVEQAVEMFESLEARKRELEEGQVAFQQELEARASRLRRELTEKLRTHIQGMSRERGWDLVLDASARSANGVPVVLSTDLGRDVTREVILSLNREEAGEEKGDGEDGA